MKNWQLVSVIVGGLAALVAISAAVSRTNDESTSSGTQVPLTPQSVVVEYDVTGTVSWADVTMRTPTGIKQESPDVPLTFGSGERHGYRFEFPRGAALVLSAQKKSDGRGAITCRILVDGRVISENTSTSAYGIASCSGSAASTP